MSRIKAWGSKLTYVTGPKRSILLALGMKGGQENGEVEWRSEKFEQQGSQA